MENGYLVVYNWLMKTWKEMRVSCLLATGATIALLGLAKFFSTDWEAVGQKAEQLGIQCCVGLLAIGAITGTGLLVKRRLKHRWKGSVGEEMLYGDRPREHRRRARKRENEGLDPNSWVNKPD